MTATATLNLFGPDLAAHRGALLRFARRKVREHRRNGATLIKIMPSGGVGSIGDDPNHMTMTDEEMRAVTETAPSRSAARQDSSPRHTWTIVRSEVATSAVTSVFTSSGSLSALSASSLSTE